MSCLLQCRSYYRCTQDDCRVKKRVERLDEDPRMVITTYEGRHIHSPSHDTQDSEPHTHLNNFFWYPLSLSFFNFWRNKESKCGWTLAILWVNFICLDEQKFGLLQVIMKQKRWWKKKQRDMLLIWYYFVLVWAFFRVIFM